MNIIERLIAWLEWNKRPCEERDLLNDALEELEAKEQRLAAAAEAREKHADKPWANSHYEPPDYVVKVAALKREVSQYEALTESLTQRLAAEEAENERLRGDGQFVVHTGDALEYYDTEKEAIEAAQRAVYDLSDDSETGWPAIVENVKVMRVVHAVKRFDHVDDAGVPFTLYSIAEE